MHGTDKTENFGKIGGLAVKNMIEEVEQRMAAGEHVNAAPTSSAEADLLRQVKEENRKSAIHSRDDLPSSWS